MPSSQEVINAMICYFFLGPVIWLARKNPNFSSRFVQSHARRSSWLYMGGILGLAIFFFAIAPLTHFPLMGFYLSDILLFVGVGAFFSFLIYSAIGAYRGGEAGEIIVDLHTSGAFSMDSVAGWTDRDRILASLSFLPFLGIWIAQTRPHPVMRQGETIGSWMMLLILAAVIAGYGYSLALLLIALFIVLVVWVTVSITILEQIPRLSWLSWLPTIDRVNALILAMGSYLLELLYLIGGKEKIPTLKDIISTHIRAPESISTRYLMPAWILAIPVVNLVALPSFFMEKYREWRWVIVEGWTITFLFLFIIFRYGSASEWIWILLFPIVMMGVALRGDPVRVDVVIISLLDRVVSWILFGYRSSREKIQTLQEQKSVEYQYEDKDKEGQRWANNNLQ